jgi:hypothetical protein
MQMKKSELPDILQQESSYEFVVTFLTEYRKHLEKYEPYAQADIRRIENLLENLPVGPEDLGAEE